MHHRLPVLLLCLFAGNAAARLPEPPAPLQITEQRNAASGFAITRGMLVDKIIQQCGALSAPLPTQAQAALTRWHGDNADHYFAALHWFKFVAYAVARDSGDRDFGNRQIAEFWQQSDRQLAQLLPDGARPQACAQLLAVIADRSYDLAASAEFGADLDQLRAYADALDASRPPDAQAAAAKQAWIDSRL